MSRKSVYMISAAVAVALFAAAKITMPHDGIGGEYVLLTIPFFTLMVEMAMLGNEG